MELWDKEVVDGYTKLGSKVITGKGELFMREYIYSRGFYDYKFFIDYFLSHFRNKPKEEWTDNDLKLAEKGGVPIYKSPKYHFDILEAYSKNDNVCSIFYRGAAKTTLLVISDLHDVLYHNYKDIKQILTVSTKSNLDHILKTIREEIEQNERIKYIFGDLQPSQRTEERNKFWNASNLYFNNGVKYFGRVKGGVFRGIRANKINVDDLQNNADVRNKNIADQDVWSIKTEVMGATDVNYKIIIQGTDLGEDCLVRRFFADKENGFVKFSLPAIENCVLDGSKIISGESIWENRYPMTWFQDKLFQIGKEAFEQEYLNISKNINSNPVFESNLKLSISEIVRSENGFNVFKDISPQNYTERLIMGVDTSSGDSKDKSAISIRGMESGELIATFNDLISLEDLAEKVNWWFEQGYYCHVYPEINYSDYFISLLRNYPWFYTWVARRGKDPEDTSQKLKDYGFHTSAKTKKRIVDIYGKNLRGNDKNLSQENRSSFQVSHELSQQIKSYERDGNKMNARSGQYDDLLMADMICCYGVEDTNYRL